MKQLIDFVTSRIHLSRSEMDTLNKYFMYEEVAAHTSLLKAGNVERYIYFLVSGIVKGYQNIEGKIVVQHLVAENEFFTSLDSFMEETPSIDYYETITACRILKISKPDYDHLYKETTFWASLVKEVTQEHLSCKLERVRDFQVLTAKERYLKFLDRHPKLALNVSIENMASFLGVEPQSLSRIRKQITF